MTDADLIDVLRRNYRPLEPEPTGVEPRLERLGDVRAVLFDIYGTLVVSGSGEVGTTREAASRASLEAALTSLEVPFDPPLSDAVDLMQERIREEHAQRRTQGVDFPEIQIAEVWQWVFSEMVARGRLSAGGREKLERLGFERLAVEYEARANPCWPMPHLESCLSRLREGGLRLGLISNAQFYTPLLFPALLGRSAQECGFEQRLSLYSYRHGQAKPGVPLYEMAAERLREHGIESGQTLYVGNDMLNDVMPAARVGFRTALFAGDRRSLRQREDDPRVAGVSSQLVITDLAQLPACSMIG